MDFRENIKNKGSGRLEWLGGGQSEVRSDR